MHLKLWTLERYLNDGDPTAEMLYRQYIALLREMLKQSEDFCSKEN